MIFKFSRYLFFIGLFAFLSSTAFAEGTVLCSGKIMGETTNQNVDEGRMWFDAHGAPDTGVPPGYEAFYGKTVDVGVLDGVAPGTMGLAPADAFPDAACVGEATGTLNYDSDGDLVNDATFDYEYKLEGYAWNDNLGFINLLGSESGYDQYAVVIGPEVAGFRDLAGYAWSGSAAGPAFGYIQFKGVGNDGSPFNYGVKMNTTTGALSGHAWTEAGMWIDFTGVTIELPGAPIPPGSDVCDGVEYMCVDVTVNEGINDYWYDLDVYLMDSDGVTPLDLSTYDISASFSWEDTVKLNQLAYSEGDFDADSAPAKNGGGILTKPLAFADNTEFLQIFEPVTGDPGHYVLQEKIQSFAPTSASNVSQTTSTLPPISVKNEFFADELSINGGVWTSEIETNELVLKSVAYDITKGGGPIKSDVVYPRRSTFGYRFEFPPVIDLGTLYAGDNEDTIVGFRNIPIGFTMEESHGAYVEYSDPEVYLVLDYNRTLTASECSDKDYVSFEYDFTDESFEILEPVHGGSGKWDFDSGVEDPYTNAVKFDLDDLTSEKTVNAVASIPEYDPDDPEETGLPCDVVQGPTLYSVVKYTVDTGDVYYYSNKIPRIFSAAYNPSAVIHGNVYASSAFSTTASHDVQETGFLAVNIIRNTINENINKRVGELDLVDGGACEVYELDDDGNVYFTGACASNEYEVFSVGDEYVLYMDGTALTLNMGDPAYASESEFTGKWVVIVQDAPIFIDSDLYREVPPNRVGELVIVSLSTYEGSCDSNNIYLHADVKNIDANIVADCSLFPYHPTHAMPTLAAGSDGIPPWTFDNKVQYLDKQKLFRGSIASRNTIGGADLDSLAGKEYLLKGTGEIFELPVTLEERLDAQNYDLNYMAFFMLSVETSDAGWPIDQRCQKALTIEDMITINGGGTVIGENGEQCDGIDLVQYDPNTWYGDLVVPEDGRVNLARGLDSATDFNPIYIYARSSDSFVFESAGAVTSESGQ